MCRSPMNFLSLLDTKSGQPVMKIFVYANVHMNKQGPHSALLTESSRNRRISVPHSLVIFV